MRTMPLYAALLTYVALLFPDPSYAQPRLYMDGLSDRTSYENWIASLSAQERAGAEYWAGQRSLSRPGSCGDATQARNNPWVSTCVEAQRRLGPTDARRQSEPEYRAGWNSYSSSQATSSSPPRFSQQDEDAALNCDARSFPSGAYSYVSQAMQICERRKEAAREAISQRKKQRERNDREAAQLAAERSSDNICAKPDIARTILSEMGSFNSFKNRNIGFIDIERLITLTFNAETFEMACHGIFISDTGLRLAGTFKTRKNIAGDSITSWKLD